MSPSQSLAPQTGIIIEAISRLECIKPFVLVGGIKKLSPRLHDINMFFFF